MSPPSSPSIDEAFPQEGELSPTSSPDIGEKLQQEEGLTERAGGEEKAWQYKLAEEISRYFLKPYQDTNLLPKGKTFAGYKVVTKEVNGTKYTIQRPGHNLSHGMRKGFLAVDIITALKQINLNEVFLSPKNKGLIQWVQRKLKEDPHFIQKAEMLSAFQRTGRQSEIAFNDNQEKYNEYKEEDAKNFKKMAHLYMGQGGLFKDSEEVDHYANALLPGDPGVKMNAEDEYVRYLSTIIFASHELDLRRQSNNQSTKNKACKMLFGEKDSSEKIIKNICDNLWAREEEYLVATGFNISGSRPTYNDKFFTISKEPHMIVDALVEARKNSNIQNFTLAQTTQGYGFHARESSTLLPRPKVVHETQQKNRLNVRQSDQVGQKSSIEMNLDYYCKNCQSTDLASKYGEYFNESYIDAVNNKMTQEQKNQLEVLKSFIKGMAAKEIEFADTAYSVYHGGSGVLLYLMDLNAIYQELKTGGSEHNLVRITPKEGKEYQNVVNYMTSGDVGKKLKSGYASFFDGRGMAADLMSVSLSILQNGDKESAVDFFIKQSNEALDATLARKVLPANLNAIGINKDHQKYFDLLDKYLKSVQSCMVQFSIKKDKFTSFAYLAKPFGLPLFTRDSSFYERFHNQLTKKIMEDFKWNPGRLKDNVTLRALLGIDQIKNLQGRILVVSPEIFNEKEKEKALQYFIYFDPAKHQIIEKYRAEFKEMLKKDLNIQ